jgi:hypothetical protein
MAQISPTLFKVDLPGLKSVYLVFYTLLLELFDPKGLILHLETKITDTLRTFSNNV